MKKGIVAILTVLTLTFGAAFSGTFAYEVNDNFRSSINRSFKIKEKESSDSSSDSEKIDQLLNSLNQRELQLEQLQLELKQTNEQNSDLKLQVKTLTSQLSEKTTELESAQSQVETLQQKKTQLETQLSSVTSEKNNLEEQLSEKITELETAQSQIETLQQEKTRLEQQLEEADNSETISDLQNQLKQKTSELESAQSQVESLQQEKTQLETQLASATSEKTQLEQQLSEKTNELETTQSKVSNLESQIEQLKSEKQLIESQISEKEEEIKRLNEKINSLGQSDASAILEILQKINNYVYFEKRNGDIVLITQSNSYNCPNIFIIDKENLTIEDIYPQDFFKEQGQPISRFFKYFCELENGDLLFSADSTGVPLALYNVQEKSWSIIVYSSGIGNLKLLKNGKVLICPNSYGNGFSIFDPNTNKVTSISTEGRSFEYIFELDNGDCLIAGKLTEGIYYYNLEENSIKLVYDKYNYWMTFLKLKNNKILICGRNLDILIFDPTDNSFTTISTTSQMYGFFYQLDDGKVLMGSIYYNSGLTILDTNTNTVKKVYASGTGWDTFELQEDGNIKISASDHSPQGDLIFNTSTGTCTKV